MIMVTLILMHCLKRNCVVDNWSMLLWSNIYDFVWVMVTLILTNRLKRNYVVDIWAMMLWSIDIYDFVSLNIYILWIMNIEHWVQILIWQSKMFLSTQRNLSRKLWFIISLLYIWINYEFDRSMNSFTWKFSRCFLLFTLFIAASPEVYPEFVILGGPLICVFLETHCLPFVFPVLDTWGPYN